MSDDVEQSSTETVGDANVAALVARAGERVTPDPAFAARVTERLRADARARRAEAQAQAASWRALLAAGLSGAALGVALLTSAALLSRPEAPARAQPAPAAVPAPTPRVAPRAEPAAPTSATPEVGAPPAVAPPSEAPPPEVPPPGEDPGVTAQGPPAPPAPPTAASLLAEAGQLQPRPRVGPVPSPRASVGQTIATGPRERRRLALDDGSTLDVDAATRVVLLAERRVRVDAGRVAVDVAPRGLQDPFVVEAEGRTLTALGTRFVVAAGAAPELLVAHGRVRVGGPGPALDVQAGWRADLATGSTAPLGPASRALSWTRDLAVAAESPLVVGASGPALLVKDAAGQEASLPLRRTSVDVVVEDGFARTAIDLTFFNRTWQRLEGTFRLPLPAGASISRLAMYCEGKLMEGACVERERARTVFETIRHQRRDPALLEWLDGSVFKLRVFPIEPRQEKRVVLCYTQRLDVRPEGTTYRLLGGGPARPDRFSVRARIRGGRQRAWDSRTHELAARTDGEDLVLEHLSLDASALAGTAGDLVLDLGPEAAATSLVGGAGAADVVDVGGWRYLAVRARCDLPVAPRPARRAWVVAVETSADRDPLLARTALDAARGLLAQAGPDDLFALLSASTRTTLVSGLGPVTPAAVEAALGRLEQVHLVGALDLGAELEACAGPLAAARAAGAEPWLVQLGTALPVLGERDPDALLARLPAGARLLGVGVGRRWNQGWLRRAAARTGGHVDQLHPDEPIGWRASEIASALDAPRLLDLKVEGAGVELLVDRAALLAGDELFAVARLKPGQSPPAEVVVSGSAGGAFARYPLRLGVPRAGASHLARTWGRLEVERLLASDERMLATSADPEAIRREVVALGTSLNLITPFTSLLVLENEAMHREFNVPMGTREHWAPYDLPATLPVVTEAIRTTPAPGARRPRAEVLASILRRRAVYQQEEVSGVPWGATFDGLPAQLVVRAKGGESFSFDDVEAEPEGRRDVGFGRQIPAQGNARASRLGPIVGPAGGKQTLFGSSLFGGRTENILDGRNRYFGGERLNRIDVDVPEDAEGSKEQAERWLGRPRAESRTRELRLGDDGDPDHEDGDEVEAAAASSFTRRLRLQPDANGNVVEALGFDDLPADTFGQWNTGVASGADLLDLCPGFDTTSADVDAVLDAEAELDPDRQPGAVEPAARALLDRARRAGWERVELRGGGVVRHEGGGRFVLERQRALGLVERVACDGASLVHAYPDLGLAARRKAGPAYRGLLSGLVPWAAPSADELSRGADVRAVGSSTVSVVPRDPRRPVEELVFEGERLVERRRLDPAGVVVARKRYLRTSTSVEVVREVTGQPARRWTVALAPCAAPALAELQAGADLVVLPMPWRNTPWPTAERDLEGADEAAALGWIAGALGRGEGYRVPPLVASRFLERGDRRPGWYPLVAAAEWGRVPAQRPLFAGRTWKHGVGPRTVELAGPTVDAPVAWFVAQQAAWQLQGGLPRAEVPGAAPGSFLARLALALHTRESSRQGGGARWVDRDGALGLLERLAADPALRDLAVELAVEAANETAALEHTGWRRAPAVTARLDALLERAGPASGDPLVALLGRLHLHAAGDRRAAALDLLARAADQAAVPPRDAALEAALGELGADEALAAVDAVARALVGAGRRDAALAWSEALGAGPLAARVVATARAGATPDELRALLVGEARRHAAFGRDEALDAAVTTLLADARALPPDVELELCELGARAAAGQGRTGRAVALAERALALQDQDGAEVVDLVLLRARTSRLLAWLGLQLEAYRRLDQPVPADLAPRVVRAVDRLRAVDGPGSSAECHGAAELLERAGAPALAWDYQVTTVALAPDEAPRWAALAQLLAVRGRHAQADEALARACEVEPTNADLLLQRAKALLDRGERTRARPLLERLVKERWQPRFAGSVQYARQLLQN